MQRTIRKPVHVKGTGLHTGCAVSLNLKPAPVGTGIVFRRTDLQGFEIEARRKWVSRVVLATTLMKQGVMLSTVEHLLSAVYALGLDNLFIEIDSLEVPILDGSSMPFVELINEAGIQEQDEERTYLVITRKFRLDRDDKFIELAPCASFQISYEIVFEHPVIGRQKLDLEITPESYTREIAFARTFGFYEEAEELRKKGLIRGGSFDNAVVLSEDRVMNGELRAPDEFVRHKALDLIGDIALCGFPIIGRIRAFKAGHALHTLLATELSRNRSLTRLRRESELDPAVAVNQ